MGGSVDQKVIELEFDNNRFNENLKSTVKALEEFRSTMKSTEKPEANVSKVSSSLKEHLGTTMANVVDSARSCVTTIASNIQNGIVSAADHAKGMAKIIALSVGAAATAVSGLIVAGGTKRALNLEHANFQLKGLLKNTEKVEAVMSDVNKSVDGTAYGLDEAAVIAAQLAASGIQAGEDAGQMYDVLKGVAGVAAMGGAEYSRVGQIFATVAGNGRLMGDQLLQLSSMGLNAASTLRDYFKEVGDGADHTEEEIRDMVSKGEISFETFASAMSWAFGEHATKANETFTGAMSNVKAALSRIGAEFAIPSIENLRRIFVSLIPVINTIKKAMSPMVDLFKSLTTGWTDSIVNFFDSWAKKDSEGKTILVFADKLKRRFENIEDYISLFAKTTTPLFSVIFSRLSQLFRVISTAFEGAFGQKNVTAIYTFAKYLDGLVSLLMPMVNYLGALNATFLQGFIQSISDAVPGVLTLVEKIAPAVERVGLSIRNAFPTDMVTGISSWGSAFTSFVTTLSIPETLYFNIERIGLGIRQTIRAVGDTIKGAVDGVAEIVKGIVDGFIAFQSGGAKTPEWIFPLQDLVGFVSNPYLPQVFRDLGKQLGDLFRSIGSGQFFSKGLPHFLSEFLGKFYSSLRHFGEHSRILGALGRVFEKFRATVSVRLEQVFGSSRETFAGDIILLANKMVKWQTDKLSKFADYIRKLVERTGLDIGDILGIVNTAVLSFVPLLSKNLLGKVADNFVSFVGRIQAFLSLDSNTRKAAFTELVKPLKDFKNSSKDFVVLMMATFKTSKIVQISIGIATAILALKLLSSLTLEKTVAGLAGLLAVAFGMLKALEVIGSSIKDLSFGTLVSLGAAMTALAVGLLLLAGVIRLIGAMKPKTLLVGFFYITTVLLTMVSVCRYMSKAKKQVASAAVVSMLAVALVALGVAVELMGSMRVSTLATGLLGFAMAVLLVAQSLIIIETAGSAVLTGAASMAIAVGAMILVASVLQVLAFISFEEMLVAITGFGSAALLLVGYLEIMAAPVILEGAAGILGISAALVVLAATLLVLSRVPIAVYCWMLAGLAVTVGIFALISTAVVGAIPGISAVAGVLAVVGGVLAVLGGGTALLAASLAAFAADAPNSVLLFLNMIVFGVSSIVALLPQALNAAINVAMIVLQAIADGVNALVVSISGMLHSLMGFLLSNAGQMIVTGSMTAIQLLASFRAGLPNAIVTGMQFLLTAAEAFAESIPELISNAWTLLLLGINSAANFLRSNHESIYQAGKQMFFSFLETLIHAIVDAVNGIIESVTGVKDALSGDDLFAEAGEELGKSAKKHSAENLSGTAEGASSVLGEKIVEFTQSIDVDVSGTFGNLASDISSGFSGVDLPKIGKSTTESVTQSQRNTSGFRSGGELEGSSFSTGMVSGVEGYKSSISGEASDMAANAGSASGLAKEYGYSVGSNFGHGLYDGIDKCIKSIANKAAEMVRKAKKKTDKEEDAGSPSRDLMRTGSEFGGLFNSEITTMIKHVRRTAASMAPYAKSAFLVSDILNHVDLYPWPDRPSVSAVFELSELSDEYYGNEESRMGYSLGVPFAVGDSRRDIPKNRTTIRVNFNGAEGTPAAEMAYEMALLLRGKNLF